MLRFGSQKIAWNFGRVIYLTDITFLWRCQSNLIPSPGWSTEWHINFIVCSVAKSKERRSLRTTLTHCLQLTPLIWSHVKLIFPARLVSMQILIRFFDRLFINKRQACCSPPRLKIMKWIRSNLTINFKILLRLAGRRVTANDNALVIISSTLSLSLALRTPRQYYHQCCSECTLISFTCNVVQLLTNSRPYVGLAASTDVCVCGWVGG